MSSNEKKTEDAEQIVFMRGVLKGVIAAAYGKGLKPVGAIVLFVTDDGTFGSGAVLDGVDFETFDRQIVTPVFSEFDTLVQGHMNSCIVTDEERRS